MALTFTTGDLISTRLNFGVTGQTETAMNVIHYQLTVDTGTPSTVTSGLSDMALAVYDHFKAEWAEGASDQVTFKNVTATSVFPLPRSVSVTAASDVGTPGAISSQPIPLQDTPTVLKKTDVGARWGLGRLFYVGVPELHQDAGILSGAGIAALENFVDKVDDSIAIIGTGWIGSLTPVLVRGPEDNPVSITTVRSAILSGSVLKTQRRRRPGKGS